MPEMRAANNKDKDKDKARYFRGDEVGGKPEPVRATPLASAAAASKM
jgi:hypothetical protein